MPIIHYQISSLQDALKVHRCQHSQRIALVPTMGNLHAGHMALVTLAKQHADIVVVSIFVNPTQFGVGEDFDSYPRTLAADVEKLASVGADYVFAPSNEEMYPVLPVPTAVRAGAITTQLCGQSRPTHFDGVGLVVSKLFNIVQPDVAIFGQKDYQQLAIIKQLVRDLSYAIDIIGAPIVRADDGLALSSRNQYLSADERQIAPILHQSLQHLAQQLASHELTAKTLDTLLRATRTQLITSGFIMDYLEVKTLGLAAIDEHFLAEKSDRSDLIILVAASLGRARLLDNQQVNI